MLVFHGLYVDVTARIGTADYSLGTDQTALVL